MSIERVHTERCKPTNAEGIRAMSDEELAEIITMTCPPQCKTCVYEEDEEDSPCVRCWLAWLKSPAESSVFESMKRGLEQAINGETRSETLTLTKDGET